MARGGHAMPRHGHALVTLVKWRCWQVVALMQKGERMLQGSREGRVGPGPTPILSMGLKFNPACQVFDQMPERKIFLNFEKIFGGV